jgi:hypothetical protein
LEEWSLPFLKKQIRNIFKTGLECLGKENPYRGKTYAVCLSSWSIY